MKVIAVFHPRENLRKCTLWPLVTRGDIEARTFADAALLDWSDKTILDPAGDPLSPADAGRTLVIIDGTWRYARKMSFAIQAEKRSLRGFVTAYPRTSKLFRDPPGGLASAEALFAAKLMMGARDDSSLDFYRWKEDFLRTNARLISEIEGGRRQA